MFKRYNLLVIILALLFSWDIASGQEEGTLKNTFDNLDDPTTPDGKTLKEGDVLYFYNFSEYVKGKNITHPKGEFIPFKGTTIWVDFSQDSAFQNPTVENPPLATLLKLRWLQVSSPSNAAVFPMRAVGNLKINHKGGIVQNQNNQIKQPEEIY